MLVRNAIHGDFHDSYASQGRRAGTYTFANNRWSLQNSSVQSNSVPGNTYTSSLIVEFEAIVDEMLSIFETRYTPKLEARFNQLERELDSVTEELKKHILTEKEEMELLRIVNKLTLPDSSNSSSVQPNQSNNQAAKSQTKTYYATTNLRLRSEPNADQDNIVTLIPEGETVEFLERGISVRMDGITAPWFRVKTTDGTVGWAFSGYLEEKK